MRSKDKRRLSSLLLGLAMGLLGSALTLLPPTAGWEEGLGLGLLFKLRGERPPPPEVAIVSINGETAAQLGLGEEIPDWPRSLHAELIERLSEAGVAAIAIDIFFKKPRDPATDGQLAAAIEQAGNVLLVGYLEQQRVRTGPETLYIERLTPPVRELADAAVGVAPFVLPKIPVRVSRFWTFHGEDALPSLPVLSLQQLAAANDGLIDGLLGESRSEGLAATKAHTPVSRLQMLRKDPALRDRLLRRVRSASLPEHSRERLGSLLALTAGEPYPYLNFYGPPSTLLTLPYQQILSADSPVLEELRNRVVFIGYAGDYQPDQRDGFYTVFSQDNGLDLSGVEIAATAFANLLHGESIAPLAPLPLVVLLLSYGLAVTLLLRRLPGSRGVAASLLLSLLYFALVYILFNLSHIWLPWFIPLAIQTPLAMILVLSWHYRQMRHSREQLRELFGYYLPGEVIEQLAEDRDQAMEQRDKLFGVCLASDARQYTSLAERMDPQALQAYLNRYYEILFAPVRARDGVVSDVVGDAMLAIWPATAPSPALRQKACEAALDMVHSLHQSSLQPPLPTGIGLHAGELVMSHVGAIDHFEYRAVGDIVNTANRIETMNKTLGTRILASEAMLTGLSGILTRELGAFMVAGRQQPIVLHEVAALEDEADETLRELHRDFGEALAEWKAGHREQARTLFERILEHHPEDGPSTYYIAQFHERRRSRINPLNQPT